MTFMQHLPAEVVDVLRTQVTAEYATLTMTGVPIDTPTYFFPSEDLSTIDVATGLAYPAKAERARKNPKVGLLVQGKPGQPVVSIAGEAAVRDSDLQANLERYMRETLFSPNSDPAINDWRTIRETMLYYFTRMIIEITPVHVRWWPSLDAMDQSPREWRAPAGVTYPSSDPAAPGKGSAAPGWDQPTWQELRARSLSEGLPGHLCLVDAEGYPAPMPVRGCREHPDGFELDVPASVPWRAGKATLSFIGKEIFVGEAEVHGGKALLRVERALPVWPLMTEAVASERTHDKLMARLVQEAERRGVSLPVIPETPPEPTEGACLRAEGYRAMGLVGADEQ